MILGYNTNGLSEHAPEEAIRLLAEIGYQAVAISLNHHTLNPFMDSGELNRQADRIGEVLAETGMRSVIETGARFLLDRRHKHQPTLLSADPAGRERRVQFLQHAIDMAQRLGSDCVSFWSGTADQPAEAETLLERLAAGLQPVLEYAADHNVRLGFEPEPGMFIDTMAAWDRLAHWVDNPALELTLDLGHLYCLGEVPIADYIARYASRIINVHIEDMRAGVHEHLMFGEGEMDFPPILHALRQSGYRGPVCVELSRHSHVGPAAATQAFEFLQPKLEA